MTTKITYEPLESPRSIRLLQIKDAYLNDPLTCVLSHHILDTAPPFTALSYVWGNPDDTADITCNGLSINVGLNLSLALVWLRARNEELSPYIWADALCINQDDPDEKCSQVKLMGDIYSLADRVVSYIGEETPELNDVWQLLNLLFGAAADASKSPLHARGVKTIFHQGYLKQVDPRLSRVPPHDSPKWKSLINFWRRDYFSRMWIVQEIVLAKQEPMVICGACTVEWNAIARSARMLRDLDVAASGKFPTNFLNVCMLQDMRDKVHGNDLLYLLAATHRLRCGQPLDKVYALYGLAGDIHEDGDEGSALFEPDYRLSVDDMLIRLTVQLIKRKHGLNVLTYAVQQPDRPASLPSWVPAWIASTDADGSITKKKLLSLGLRNTKNGYKASLDPGPIFLSKDSRQLHLQASRVGVIRWASRALEIEHFDMYPSYREPLVLVDAWNQCMKQLGDMDTPYAGGGSVINAMWRTFIANRNRVGAAVADDYYIHFLHYWKLTRIVDVGAVDYQKHHPRRSLADKNEAADPDDPGDIMEWQTEVDAEMIGQDPLLAEYYRRVREGVDDPIPMAYAEANAYASVLARVCGRLLFVTDGQLVGLGDPSIVEGDEVWLLPETEMPFVLRPVGDGKHILMGEAYVHGIMNGEGMQRDEEGLPIRSRIVII